MLDLYLYRSPSTDDGTLGLLHGPDGLICYMGELPWRDNRNNVSCIPPGRYLVEYLERSVSGKYRDVYHIQGTGHRLGVLQHTGNFTGDVAKGKRTDSHGCQLPGLRVGRINGQRVVLASASALQAIHCVTGRKNYWLNIINEVRQ